MRRRRRTMVLGKRRKGELVHFFQVGFTCSDNILFLSHLAWAFIKL
jgi:hypothetical protein